MSERKGYGAAIVGGLMVAAAVAIAVVGGSPSSDADPVDDRPPPRHVNVLLDEPSEPVELPSDPREDRADADAAALAPDQWGAPDPLPDLSGTWCITTATSASGKPARLLARETWTASGDPGEYRRSGHVGVEFDRVDWARVDYDGALAIRDGQACVSHTGSTWIPSEAPGRAERAEYFEFAELTMRDYYGGKSFRAGACQPLVRAEDDVVTVQRGDGFGHWLRCE
ncbi:MAG: hypothetical protein GY898_34525 [Proteobacteria bacterium]|nr:hypothetical protein [Pseudomonadota bacterium]